MGREEIHRAVERGRRIVFAQLLHAVAEVFRAAAEQIGHQRRAERVVHQAVRLAAQQVLAALGVGDLRRAVLPDLAEKISVGALLVHRRANFGNELVGELVGDVEPPAGCASAQPVLDNGIITLDDVVNITFFQLVDCGQVLDAPPGVVLVGEWVEVVPAVVGRLLALRRAEVVVKAVGVEIDALSPRVVEDTVEHHVDAALFRLRAERAEVRFIAEQRVNALIAGGVVAVVGRGLEDRAEVECRHTERGEVVELFRDPLQVTAEKVAARDLALGVRAVFGKLVPIFVQRARADKACNITRFSAAEAVGEDLIRHAAAEPRGRFVCVVVDRELPGLDRVPRAEAVFTVAARAAVRPRETKVVPDELHVIRRGEDAAIDDVAVLLRGSKLHRRPLIGKLAVSKQLAARDRRAALGAKAERDIGAAGHRAKGRFEEKIARIKPFS